MAAPELRRRGTSLWTEFGAGVSELSSLAAVDDDAILANTRVRYNNGNIYTRSGRLLLAVNPYRQLPLYRPEILETYKESLQPQSELPPHVYAVASSALLGMMSESCSQSVIISGESGAGKTETAKILLQYLAAVSSSAGADLHERVLRTNPIMENFGNARTVWNNNSSRFGKFLTLQFSASGRMQGAFMRTYLLEKSRITSQLPDEQNYHVLYQVAHGLSPALKAEYGLGAYEEHAYLNVDKTKSQVEWDQFPCTFAELEEAMEGIPTVAPHRAAVFKVVAAILHLGNARFVGEGEDDAKFSDVGDGSPVAQCARLLGAQTAQLTAALCTLNIKAGLDWIAKPNTTEYAMNAKHALSKALYSRLFDALVELINESLIHGETSRFFIGAVDIFGFECFPRNSMEQLCINFANEKLQRMFTEAVFESVLAEYNKEGIDVQGMTFEDNSAVVKLIEGSPGGLLTLLSEECFFPNGSDSGWLGKIKEQHRKHPCFEEYRQDKQAFTVLHYPGKVTYDSVGFLEKNKDPLSQDVKVLMQFSDDEFVASLFTDKVKPGGGRQQFKSAKFVGVIDAFRKSLNELVDTLKTTKTHFIRCVKPNEKKRANEFEDAVMTRQLYTSGVVQAVRATRSGFPDHLPFPELINRYGSISDESRAAGKMGGDGPAVVRAMLKAAKVDEAHYRVGKTKVFLGVGVLDSLEYARMQYLAAKVVSMQMMARCYLARRELKARAAAAAEKKRLAAEKAYREAEQKRKAEEAARAQAEREAAAAAAAAEKAKEAEEKERQDRFRRARQLSFERKTAKQKREEREKKEAAKAAAAAAEAEAAAAAELEATAGAVAKARASLGGAGASADEIVLEEVAPPKPAEKSGSEVGLMTGGDGFGSKLQSFQQDVADGTAEAKDAGMMNVAVVSDIGWKSATGQDPSQEDVWAQYDFKCAVSDVLEYAEYLGMDIKEDAHLLWIADEALQAPEPQGWEQRLDPKGGVYYYHPTTGMSLNQHPLDHHYQQFYMQMKAQYDAMYASNQAAANGGGGGGGGAPAASEFPVHAEQPAPPATPEGAAAEAPVGGEKKKKGGLLGKLGLAGKKAAGPTEEMYQLTVDLNRQQDGLGIGLTLDNIIVEVEPGGSVAAQGDLKYGDQIVQVDGISLQGRMLKDVIVPRRSHQLVVRYSRVSNHATSPRRARARKVEAEPGAAPRRIEELDVLITREPQTNRLGFGIDQMNTVVEVDPRGPVATKLQVGDKIVAVDGEILHFRKFVEVVGDAPTIRLRVARLRAAAASGSAHRSKREKLFGLSRKKRRASEAKSVPGAAKPQPAQPAGGPGAAGAAASKKMASMPALREVKLVKDTEDTKIGAVFHRLDDAFDKSFFNVEGSSVQPIIKKVDPGSMAERGGLVPGDIILSVNGVSGLSNFQVVEMLRKGQGVFTLVVISGRQVQAAMVAAQQPQQPAVPQR